MQHEDDPRAQWHNVHTVTDFLAYLTVYDADHLCAHDRLWTRCWSCGHFEDYLDDADALD